MAINITAKQRQSAEVINTLIHAMPAKREHKKEKKLKNLRIDADLASEYEIFCEYILKSSFTDQIIKYIESEVFDNKEEIESMRKKLNL